MPGAQQQVITIPGSWLCLISQKISVHVLNIREMQPLRLLTQTLVCTGACIETGEKKNSISLDQIFGNTNAAEIEAETCFKPWNTSQWCRGRKQTVFFLYIVFHVSNEVTHKICIIQAAWINDGPQRFRSFLAQLESRATFLDWRNETILIINLSCLSFSSTPLPLTPTHPPPHPRRLCRKVRRGSCVRSAPHGFHQLVRLLQRIRARICQAQQERRWVSQKSQLIAYRSRPPAQTQKHISGWICGPTKKNVNCPSAKGLSCGCDSVFHASKGALLNPFASVQYLHVVQKT